MSYWFDVMSIVSSVTKVLEVKVLRYVEVQKKVVYCKVFQKWYYVPSFVSQRRSY
jgi:hypothetical protein